MSVAICRMVGLCLERANTGWISEGARFNAAANAVANNDERRNLRAEDDAAANGERSENLRIATVERQRVPHRHGHESHDGHRPCRVEQLDTEHL